jgi:hypothetical protein
MRLRQSLMKMRAPAKLAQARPPWTITDGSSMLQAVSKAASKPAGNY